MCTCTANAIFWPKYTLFAFQNVFFFFWIGRLIHNQCTSILVLWFGIFLGQIWVYFKKGHALMLFAVFYALLVILSAYFTQKCKFQPKKPLTPSFLWLTQALFGQVPKKVLGSATPELLHQIISNLVFDSAIESFQ